MHHAERYLAGLPDGPVAASVSGEQLRSRLAVALGDEGVDPQRVIDDLAAAAEGGLLRSGGGRFFAWVIGGALPSAAAADWLASVWDQNAALHACSPAACVAEEVAGDWLKDVLDLPRQSSFAFTSGCQMAHFVGLAAARHAVLRAAGWDVEDQGLCGAPPVRILVNAHRHASVDRALRYLGIGRRGIEPLETDALGRVRQRALSAALEQRRTPTVLVLGAGEINTGSCDDFAGLIPIARDHGAWVHVDGAFGLVARASRSARPLLRGVELADSWATDGHKWLNVPFDCGVAIVRDAAAHRAAMSIRADYIAPTDSAHDPIDWTPEWSRRARGFAVYAALRELGRLGLERMVDRACRAARALVDGLGALPGVSVIAAPTLNQGLVRFLDPSPDAREADHDARTDRVIAAINATGEAFFSGTTWHGRRAMRVSVVNWRTGDHEVARTLAACERALRSAGPHTTAGA
ncbi:MAG: aspartate aminotransferase family protein [Phycisphaerales bacterium]|nr:aspartate aminotransferase family protein [Phycisphaerales bacterium]